MVNILKQFNPDKKNKVYSYGTVISIEPNGVIKIRITTGLELRLKDTYQVYSVGDQLILGTKNGNLNSIFVIRKINRVPKSSINFVISN